MNDEQLENCVNLSKRVRADHSDPMSITMICDAMDKVVASHRELGELLMERNVECNKTLQQVFDLTDQLALAKSDLEIVRAKMKPMSAHAPKPGCSGACESTRSPR